jgi:hypothetical protein
MNRPSTPRAPTRTLAQLEDSQDLESVIAKSLAARPIDVSMLRRGVWTYVDVERQAGTSPGRVILTLTELIEKSKTTSEMEQRSVMRRVILWCVEAYFGQLGGQNLGPMMADVEPAAPGEITQLMAAEPAPLAEPTIAHA